MSHHRVLNLSQLVALVPAGWSWLARNAMPKEISDGRGKYFAHVYRHNGIDVIPDRSFVEWADTPEKAFEEALRLALEITTAKTRRAEEGSDLSG